MSIAPSARAQQAQQDGDTDPAETARFRLGVLRFTPSIAISNVGIDSNVFNEAENPKRDTTAGAGPAVNLWLRTGKARWSGKFSGTYLYYKTYADQRQWNTIDELRLDLPFTRVKPYVSAGFTSSRERPGFEIDARARRTDQSAAGGLELVLSGKTSLVLSGARTSFDYADTERFSGISLADQLNRYMQQERLQFRQALTPLTSLVISADAIQDRFSVSADRNADSIRILPGFEMKPAALISGAVAVGVRHFQPRNDATIPEFNGLAANANLRYAIGATRIATLWSRDVVFSYETDEPYYALTDVGLTLTERITTKWDAIARASWQRLNYRSRLALGGDGHLETVSLYGGGVGYRLGEALRLGVDANFVTRDAGSLESRNFEGLRVGASFTYGLPQ